MDDQNDDPRETFLRGEGIIANPSHSLWGYLREDDGIVLSDREQECFELGKLCVYLELETIARTFEAVGGVTLIESLNFEVANALRSLQSAYGDAVNIALTYDELVKRVAKDEGVYVERESSPGLSLASDVSFQPQTELPSSDIGKLLEAGKSLGPDAYVSYERATEGGEVQRILVHRSRPDTGLFLAESEPGECSPDELIP